MHAFRVTEPPRLDTPGRTSDMSQASIAVELPAIQSPAKPRGPFRAMVVSAILGAAIALAAAAGVSAYRQSVTDQAVRAQQARINQAAIAMHVASERAENPVISGPFAVGIPATAINRQVVAHLQSERSDSATSAGTAASANDRQVVEHNQSERSGK
jgi:hypothetical protein